MAKKKGKKNTVFLIVMGVIIILFGILFYAINTNIRGRLFMSSVHMMTHTLKDKGYLLYDIDIMDVCRNYMNADTVVTGNVGVNETDKVKSSIFLDTTVERSFAQRKMISKSQLSLLAFKVGEMNVYGKDETVYIEVPFLSKDFGYAFPTGLDLFAKAPDLTHDIDGEWFRENLVNIGDLTTKVGIEPLGEICFEGDERNSDGFRVTIPTGCGDFIWELLGMQAPDYDVVVDMYLTKNNYIRRIEMDLSEEVEGLSVIVDGTSIGKAIITWELPDNECFQMTVERSKIYDDWFDISGSYFTNIDKIYDFSANMTFKVTDDGFEVKLHDMEAFDGKKKLVNAYFVGTVRKAELRADLFDGGQERLDGLEVLDWKAVRNDAEGFVNDVMEKLDIVSILSGE